MKQPNPQTSIKRGKGRTCRKERMNWQNLESGSSSFRTEEEGAEEGKISLIRVKILIGEEA